AVDEPEKSAHWLPLAARWAEAAGKPAEAAVFLDALLNDTGSNTVGPQERRLLQQEIESLLMAAGRSEDAYARLQQRIRTMPDDVALLGQGISLARQLGEHSQALHWNTQRLALRPRDGEAARLQAELALAVGNLPLAYRWAGQLVERHPHSTQDRENLARISEWNGKPDEALAHWQWLAGRSPSGNWQGRLEQPVLARAEPVPGDDAGRLMTRAQRLTALREMVRLAELTLRPGIAASALREITLLEEPGNDDVVQLTSLYELDGRAEQASVALRDILVLHGARPFVLRTLASHEYHHSRYAQSLAAWDEYVDRFGHSSDATLARMELLWRLNRQDEAARVAQHLKGRTQLSGASDYQLRLMAEIGWRYRMPWLALLVKPRIDAIEENDQKTLVGQRLLTMLQEDGNDLQAMEESLRLWHFTGSAHFALTTMRLAFKVGDSSVLGQFLPDNRDSRKLQETPSYWSQVAAMRLRAGDAAGARQSYDRALRLAPEDVEAIAGRLWLDIAEQDEAHLTQSLDTYKRIAGNSPELWQPMAIGYLQLGAASTSLVWFDKLLDQIESDYGMLLTYADALEYAGRSADARKVRQYTLQQLRPLLVDGTVQEQPLLLRQYSRLSARYAGVEANETLVNHLLRTDTAGVTGTTRSNLAEHTLVTGARVVNRSDDGEGVDGAAGIKSAADVEGAAGTDSTADVEGAAGIESAAGIKSTENIDDTDEAADLWREDMAISWLMSTQQHEHARVIMARLHERRLQAPAWQQLALALKDKDTAALESLVQASGPLSIGNHILALRQLGHDREAYAMAQQALRPGAWLHGSTPYDKLVAQEQYVSLRDARPGFIGGSVQSRNNGGLDIRDTGVTVRHSFAGSGLGLSLALMQRQLSSDRYALSDSEELSDIALSLYYSDAQQSVRLTTGFQSAEESDLVYGSAAYARELPRQRSLVSAEAAFNETVTLSPELFIGARQQRISVGLDTEFGRREFVSVQADATEINTRVKQNKVARGLGGSVEFGLRGSFGSNSWSTSVIGAHLEHDREDTLPDELVLSERSSMNRVLAPETQTVSVGASLSRGGINADFPQVSSPRYYLNARVGHSWPEQVVGVQVDAGAGFRVLGGDELSLSVSHDTQPGVRRAGDDTALGLNYRYHFQ
ncbi:MAG: tetratricopeptide repeat protein, partial [Granulosicoccus sp.]|nr:tetratricopeptide repeat protein [Granulosicoccus sp.]